MSEPAIGTQVQFVYQTQFLTFTPDQFGKALKEKEYTEVRSQVPNPQNPQVSISIQTFSKGDISVLLPPAPSPLIVFQILNTRNLEEKYKEVNSILHAINIYPEVISSVVFTCTTRIRAKTKPLDRLTSIVNQTFLKRVSSNLPEELKVTSIRFDSAFPLHAQGGCQVVVEPLVSSPDNFYFLSISYKTTKMGEFDRFISDFGSDMLERIIEETEENV